MSLDQYETRLLNDLMTLKILDLLFKKGKIDLWILQQNDDKFSHNLPPPVAAILKRSGVLSTDGLVSPQFTELIKHKGEFFRAKVEYLLMAIQDFLESAEDMLWDPEKFMGESRIFSGFDYSKGFEAGNEARNFTKSWSQYVSALSKDESRIIVERLIEIFNAESPAHVLELGGNMGVFGEVFERHFLPQSYVIMDIPQVCHLGEEYIGSSPAASQIRFVSGDMFETDWNISGVPRADTIIFKSVLHDWPQHRTTQLIEKACTHLEQDGRLIIIERYEFLTENLFEEKLFDAANIVFAPFYRNPASYISMIEAVSGHRFSVDIHSIDLDMKWFCLVARKKE